MYAANPPTYSKTFCLQCEHVNYEGTCLDKCPDTYKLNETTRNCYRDKNLNLGIAALWIQGLQFGNPTLGSLIYFSPLAVLCITVIFRIADNFRLANDKSNERQVSKTMLTFAEVFILATGPVELYLSIVIVLGLHLSTVALQSLKEFILTLDGSKPETLRLAR